MLEERPSARVQCVLGEGRLRQLPRHGRTAPLEREYPRLLHYDRVERCRVRQEHLRALGAPGRRTRLPGADDVARDLRGGGRAARDAGPNGTAQHYSLGGAVRVTGTVRELLAVSRSVVVPVGQRPTERGTQQESPAFVQFRAEQPAQRPAERSAVECAVELYRAERRAHFERQAVEQPLVKFPAKQSSIEHAVKCAIVHERRALDESLRKCRSVAEDQLEPQLGPQRQFRALYQFHAKQPAE